MNSLYAYAAAVFFVFIIIYITDYDWKKFFSNPYVIVAIIGLLIRVAVAQFIPGYPTDIACFKSWAQRLYGEGMSNFYTSDTFTDYPPGYMYVLFVIGFIRQVMNLAYESDAYTMLVKLPSIIADILAGIVICHIARKKYSDNISLIIGLFYVLNPLVIFISAGWGQVDAVHTLFILLSMLCLQEYGQKHNLLKGMLLFTVAVLIKPQSLMFSPIFLYIFFEKIMEDKDKSKQIKQILKYLGICALTLIVLALPFTKKLNFGPIIKQYYDTVFESYQYASVNAYNLFTFSDLNWKPLTSSLSMFGTLMIVVIVLISFYILNKTKKRPNYLFVAAFINLMTFMFSIKMHERYSFPIIALLLTSIIYHKDKKLVFLYAALTVTNLLNCADILYMIQNGNTLSLISASAKFVSMLNLFITGYAIYVALHLCDNPDEQEGGMFARKSPPVAFAVQKSEPPLNLVKNDFIAMGIITLVYAVTAFANLGNDFSPETMFFAPTGDGTIVDFGSEYNVSRIQYMCGNKNGQKFSVSFSNDGYTWTEQRTIEVGGVFSWHEESVDATARYATIVAETDELFLIEAAFRDSGQNLLPVTIIADKGYELFDEQHLVPEKRNYMNSSYFDEIYHPRTAYEFIHKLPVYEWTHPPLGKSLMSFGIMIFGMNPFGWRCVGVLFGVLMVPVIYIFGKRIFKSTFFASFAAIVFAFDFMHFAQTRIGTIDTYVTFFTMCMYYFMYEYYCCSFYDMPFKKTLKPLLFSGIFFGLAAASKWQGIYAASGIAIIFFMTMYRRWREFNYAKTQRIGNIINLFPKCFFKTIAWCCLFFIAIPALIYILSYFQYVRCEGVNGLESIIGNQTSMLNYHSGITSEHPYQSPWWSWPLILRPILFINEPVSEGIRSSISSFSNPAVAWMGIVAFFYCIGRYSRKFDKVSIFLLISFAAQYLPWVLVGRTTYIYHFFPSIPFIVLMIAYMFKEQFKGKYLAVGYICLVVILFVMFYGVISGAPVDVSYVHKYLLWLPKWRFV